MQIPPTFEQQKKPGDKGYLQYLTTVLIRMWGQLATVVNYGIEFYSRTHSGALAPGNIRGFLWEGDLTAQGLTINHNLGYVPKGFVVLRLTSSTTPFFVASTSTTITVDCNGNAPDTILLIV